MNKDFLLIGENAFDKTIKVFYKGTETECKNALMFLKQNKYEIYHLFYFHVLSTRRAEKEFLLNPVLFEVEYLKI